MSVLEIDIETLVCNWARDQGWLVAKLQWVGQTGWPDRFFLRNGIHIFIEFKKPKGGRIAPKQQHWHDEIWDHEGRAYFAKTAEEGIAILKLYD